MYKCIYMHAPFDCSRLVYATDTRTIAEKTRIDRTFRFPFSSRSAPGQSLHEATVSCSRCCRVFFSSFFSSRRSTSLPSFSES